MIPTIENLILFDQWCVQFINDHRKYFNNDSAWSAIYFLHFKIFNGELELNKQQKNRFKVVCKGLYQQGFWSNAGILENIKSDTE